MTGGCHYSSTFIQEYYHIRILKKILTAMLTISLVTYLKTYFCWSPFQRHQDKMLSVRFVFPLYCIWGSLRCDINKCRINSNLLDFLLFRGRRVWGSDMPVSPNKAIKNNLLLQVRGLLLYMMNVTPTVETVSFKNGSKHNGHSTDIFTLLLCKNIVKIYLSWLLSCAANLQSCDLVDLRRHYHYSWLPGGGTE